MSSSCYITQIYCPTSGKVVCTYITRAEVISDPEDLPENSPVIDEGGHCPCCGLPFEIMVIPICTVNFLGPVIPLRPEHLELSPSPWTPEN